MQHAARFISRTPVTRLLIRTRTLKARRVDFAGCSPAHSSCSRLCPLHTARVPVRSQSGFDPPRKAMVFVDLTLSDSDEELPAPAAAAVGPSAAIDPSTDADAAAKKRIMDFAADKAAAKRTRPDTFDDTSPMRPPPAVAKQFAAESEPEGAAAAALSSDSNAKQRIMDFARSKAAAATVAAPVVGSSYSVEADNKSSAPPAGDRAGGRDAAAGIAGISNLDLKALHEARMHRQQQQQDHAPAGASNAADAATDRPHAPCASAGAAAAPPAPAAAAAAAAGNGTAGSAPAAAGLSGPTSGQKIISLLTYNVWFKEDVAVLDRMVAIGDIVKQAGYPTFICLQEVTPFILELFSNMEWWSQYHCCPAPDDAPYFTLLLIHKTAAGGVCDSSFKERPFYNSVMGRSLRSITGSVQGYPVLVATSHLESPIPPTNWYSQQRQDQMSECLRHLDAAGVGNVVFAGDMNWTDSRDGTPPLPAGWCDAWQKLQPGQPGFTYDSKSNPMLTFKGPGLRLDRIFCKLRDWKLQSIKLVGTQPLPGTQYTHTFRNGGSKRLPVLPSDHFGLLLHLEEF